MPKRSVALIDLRAQHAELREDIDRAIAGVIDSGQFILGPEVIAFESELAAAAMVEGKEEERPFLQRHGSG